MPVEPSVRTIADLNTSWPLGEDERKTTDDHLRNIKTALKQTFPKVQGPVNLSDAEINALDGRLATLEQSSIFKSTKLAKNLDAGNFKVVNLGTPTAEQDAATKGYVDTVKQAVLQAVYPIGSLFLSTSPANPSSHLGFGTWVAYAQGRALVGVGTTTDERGETRSYDPGEEFGRYQHQLSIAEMPSHNHSYEKHTTIDPPQSGSGASGVMRHPASATTGPRGGDEPHENVQPSIAVYVWRRTA